MSKIIAYHFTSSKLRDGSPIPPIRKKLTYLGDIVLCRQGYHASLHPFDALTYAPGNLLHLVESSGNILHQDDKLVSEERTILKSFDASDLLFNFACDCALDVIDLWKAPQEVKDFLKSRDKTKAGAAARAEEAAARAAGAARAAARAAGAAAGAAARAAGAAARAAGAAAGAAARAAWAAGAAEEAAAKQTQRDRFKLAVDFAFKNI